MQFAVVLYDLRANQPFVLQPALRFTYNETVWLTNTLSRKPNTSKKHECRDYVLNISLRFCISLPCVFVCVLLTFPMPIKIEGLEYSRTLALFRMQFMSSL